MKSSMWHTFIPVPDKEVNPNSLWGLTVCKSCGVVEEAGNHLSHAPKMRDVSALLMTHYDQMEIIAENFIISESVKMMHKHKHLRMFCIAMGSWSFYDVNADPIDEDVKYIRESSLFKFLEEWDRTLGLSGLGIKVKQDGTVIRNW